MKTINKLTGISIRILIVIVPVIFVWQKGVEPMTAAILATPLTTHGVALEPLDESHRDDLRAAAADPEIWTHIPFPATGPAFDAWFDWSMAVAVTGVEVVWVVRTVADGAVVGSTRYFSIEPAHRRVEIGHTWYAPRVWGGVVNPACKLALLRYGFDDLGLNRIELKTDIRNARSQAAMAKMGAVREGVFRAHMIRPDGSLRDTVYFAVTRDDWPSVRLSLEARLAPHVKGET